MLRGSTSRFCGSYRYLLLVVYVQSEAFNPSTDLIRSLYHSVTGIHLVNTTTCRGHVTVACSTDCYVTEALPVVCEPRSAILFLFYDFCSNTIRSPKTEWNTYTGFVFSVLHVVDGTITLVRIIGERYGPCAVRVATS